MAHFRRREIDLPDPVDPAVTRVLDAAVNNSTKLPAEVQDKLKELKEQIAAGKITVKQ